MTTKESSNIDRTYRNNKNRNDNRKLLAELVPSLCIDLSQEELMDRSWVAVKKLELEYDIVPFR